MKAISIISPHYRGPRHRLENIALSLRDKFKIYLFIFSSDVPKNLMYKKGNAIFSYIKLPLIIRKLRLYYIFYVPMILFSVLKADVVFTNEAYKTASIAGLICKIMRKKMILFYGTLYFEELKLHSRSVSSIPKKFKTKLYSTMELISASTVDTIISPDRRVTRHFQARTSARPRVIDWFNTGTVNTEQFSYNSFIRRKYRETLDVPSTGIVLLFVGELHKRDGADVALKIFEKISHNRPDTWLIMIGSGPSDFVNTLKKYISTKKIDNVVLTGHVSHSLIQNYMMIADVAVLPYKEPNCGIGNVVVECMSLGIPIVASSYSEIKEVIINGKTGFVADNKQDFIEKTKKLVDNEDLRRKLGINCREYALRNFSYKAFSEKFEHLLETIHH